MTIYQFGEFSEPMYYVVAESLEAARQCLAAHHHDGDAPFYQVVPKDLALAKRFLGLGDEKDESLLERSFRCWRNRGEEDAVVVASF